MDFSNFALKAGKALPFLICLSIGVTVQSYQITGPSMQNSLQDKQLVLVNRAAYLFHAPKRGDVIAFHAPGHPKTDLIKRIIGQPGDIVKLDKTDVWVNGIKLDEPYLTQRYNPQAETWNVPLNHYFVMGDSRPASIDSRYFGCVPRACIVGKAVAVYWPLSQWELINTHVAVFARIK